MKKPSYFDAPHGARIAYHKTQAAEGVNGTHKSDLPGIVFLGGFKSDMEGTKALFLEDWAAQNGRDFLRFDYRGHGQSSDTFLNGSIGDWAKDAISIIESQTDGPQILVGSSMGGWIGLLVAREMPGCVAAFVGIAAAPDFTEVSMWAGFSPEQKEALAAKGQIELPSDYSDEPYIITQRLIEDGRNQLVMRSDLVINGPVRLIQGMSDKDVKWQTVPDLLEHIQCSDAQAVLIKGADHRLSSEGELAILARTLEELPL